MKRLGASLILAAALGMLPLAAGAQQFAITAKSVNLRAGPGRAYPIVAVLPPQAQVLVHGCLSGYSWCDVSIDVARGWVYAGNLRYLYQQGYVPFPVIAPVVGIAIVVFILDDYWGTYYPHEPWYRDRYRWAHPARPPVRTAPPPPVHPVQPAPPPPLRTAPQAHPAPPPPFRPAPQAHPAPPPRVGPGPQAHPTPGPQGGPGPNAQRNQPAARPQGQHNAPPPRGERPEHPQRP